MISAVLNVALVAYCLPFLQRLAKLTAGYRAEIRSLFLLCAGVAIVLASHTIAIWFWAAVFHYASLFSNFAESFYFTTITYTTLGYGDIILEPSVRVFASFAAIAGLLTFGISTAVLVGLLARLLPQHFNVRD